MSPSNVPPQDPIERLEARLRADAAATRRPAPDGFHAAVMARVLSGDAPSASVVEGPGSPAFASRASRVPFGTDSPGARRRRGLALVGLAAAALVLAMVQRGGDEPSVVQRTPDGLKRLASLFQVRSLMQQQVFERTERERPLLVELEALGQDTARAAATLAREMPGPVGRLFQRPANAAGAAPPPPSEADPARD